MLFHFGTEVKSSTPKKSEVYSTRLAKMQKSLIAMLLILRRFTCSILSHWACRQPNWQRCFGL